LRLWLVYYSRRPTSAKAPLYPETRRLAKLLQKKAFALHFHDECCVPGSGHCGDGGAHFLARPSTNVLARPAIRSEPGLSGVQSGFAMPSTVMAMAMRPPGE